MLNSAPLSRRDFIKTSTTALAAGALLPHLRANDQPAVVPQKMVGIQIGAVSFLDEGTDRVLDILQERGAVNALYLATFAYSRGTAGRQVPGQPLPDHGKQEYDLDFKGGNYAVTHPQFYRRTSVKSFRAPDHGDYDILADVIPKARKRGMKIYSWYTEDSGPQGGPGSIASREVDWQGAPGSFSCPLHPDYRGFVTGLTEDYCQSYDIDGVMWGSERQGPLHNAFSGKVGPSRAADSSHVTCFCEFHQQAARERGIDVARAKAGFGQLDLFIKACRAKQRPADGYFVTFWRLLMEYPELLAWEKLWTDSKFALYADIRQAAKRERPTMEVGFHVWHMMSFNPFFRAAENYATMAQVADFLKIVVYNNSGGPRYVGYMDVVAETIFADMPKDDILRMYNSWLGYTGEAPLDRLATAGMSAGYVAAETNRAREGVRGTACKIYPGLDVDIPTEAGEKKTAPADVYAATTSALVTGADGVIFSRKYSEMQLANLSAGGRAVRDFTARQAEKS